MKTLMKRTRCPPLFSKCVEKINFIHRNSETQVRITIHTKQLPHIPARSV